MTYKNNMRLLIMGIIVFSSLMSYGATNNYSVFVVGAPRSGTSCVSGVLSILGIDFGSNFHVTPFNPKGDFEDQEFDDFSRGICRDLSLIPHRPRIVNWDKEPKKEQYKKQIKEFVKKRNKRFFGVKLPLISLLLPIYLESMQEIGYIPKVVIVIRNPEEIMQSWHNRWKDPKDVIYASIAKYYFNLIKHTQGYEVLVIHFDDLVKNIELVVNQINTFIPNLKSYAQAKEELNKFIDTELKHHNTN